MQVGCVCYASWTDAPALQYSSLQRPADSHVVKWNRNAVARLYKIAHPVWMFSCNFTAPARLSRLIKNDGYLDTSLLSIADALNARAEIVERNNSNQPLGDDPLHLSPE